MDIIGRDISQRSFHRALHRPFWILRDGSPPFIDRRSIWRNPDISMVYANTEASIPGIAEFLHRIPIRREYIGRYYAIDFRVAIPSAARCVSPLARYLIMPMRRNRPPGASVEGEPCHQARGPAPRPKLSLRKRRRVTPKPFLVSGTYAVYRRLAQGWNSIMEDLNRGGSQLRRRSIGSQSG